MAVLKRIIGSKKVIEGFVPMLVALGATFGLNVGPELQALVLGVVGGVSAVLVAVQGFLDFKFGSQSDGTNGA